MLTDLTRTIKTLFWEKPNYLILYPTSRCNARCRHCYNSRRIEEALKGKRKELTFKEYQKISSHLGSIYALGISGGEPTLRPDTPKICHLFYKKNQTRYLDFHSNGYLVNQLITMVETILKNNPKLFLNVCLSVDGLEEKHNNFRGLKNGFAKAMKSITKLKGIKQKYGQRLMIKSATVFSASTQDTFLETMLFLSEQGIEVASALVRGKTRKKEEIRVETKKYLDSLKEYHLRKKVKYPFLSKLFLFNKISRFLPEIVVKTAQEKKQIFPCLAGQSLMVIYDNGDLAPCELLETIGNIRDFDYDIFKAFNSAKGQLSLAAIKQKKCYCTWENMALVNCLKSFKFYPQLAAKIIKSFLREKFL